MRSHTPEKTESTVSNSDEQWIDLCADHIICELCSKYIHKDDFYQHLFNHSKEEIELLKKLSEKTLFMTEEQFQDFFRSLEIKSFQNARQALIQKRGNRFA